MVVRCSSMQVLKGGRATIMEDFIITMSSDTRDQFSSIYFLLLFSCCFIRDRRGGHEDDTGGGHFDDQCDGHE